MAKKSLRDIGRERAEKKRAERAAIHDDQCEAGDPEYQTSACRCEERRWARYEKSMEGDR